MEKQDRNNMTNSNNSGEIIIYEGADAAHGIDVRMQGETAWLTQKQLVELFQSNKANVANI